jgi:hypothetical protein
MSKKDGKGNRNRPLTKRVFLGNTTDPEQTPWPQIYPCMLKTAWYKEFLGGKQDENVFTYCLILMAGVRMPMKTPTSGLMRKVETNKCCPRSGSLGCLGCRLCCRLFPLWSRLSSRCLGCPLCCHVVVVVVMSLSLLSCLFLCCISR